MDDLGKYISFLLPEAKIEADALDVLRLQRWPGNLRELAGALGEAAVSANGGAIKRDHLPRELRLRAGIETPPGASKPLALDTLLEAVEKRLIQLALRRANNHQTEAADQLGIFRARLWRRLEALGIPVPPQPPKPRKREV
jgi:DNA-binding NtrC family response regulator